MIEDVERNSPLGKSDHMIIIFSFRAYTDRPKKKEQKFRSDKGDYEAMRSAMKDYDWKENVNALSVEEHCRFFKKTLAKHMKKHIPKTSGWAALKTRYALVDERKSSSASKKGSAQFKKIHGDQRRR